MDQTMKKDPIEEMQERNRQAFASQFSRLTDGRSVEDKRIHISIPTPKRWLIEGFQKFVSDFEWQPEYEEVAEWLRDNKGKGLLCMGNCGRGKTVITQRIIPILLRFYHGLVVNTITANDLNEHYDEIKQYKIIGIDDVGTESESVKYGERHVYFNEIVDLAERKDKLLILSTNLDGDEIKERYGARTADRLRGLTTQIIFPGESLRR